MAEAVHRNLELMLPELEELERSGIFSPEEIKEIIRRRRNMEYKLHRRPVRLEDFFRAITYELNLDRLRRLRKKKLGVTSTRRDAEYGIQDRVHSLFKRAVKRFKADIRLWLQYIDFCQKTHHHITLGKILAQALTLHPNRPGLWVMAAKFQFEEQHDPSSGRSIMQQGLRSNPTSKHLWLEYFRLELMHVDKIKKRQHMLGLEKSTDEEIEKLGEEFFSYQIPSIVYHEAVKAIPNDIRFHLEFVTVYHLFENTEQRQEEVYRNIKCGFSQLALCWETLARRQWTVKSTPTEVELIDLESSVEQCYKDGLNAVVDEEKCSLWKFYLQWCRERVENDAATDNTRLRAITSLLNGYAECTDAKLMSETMIEEQVEVLIGLGLHDEACKALINATSTLCPHSHTLWLLRLKYECGELVREKAPECEKKKDDTTVISENFVRFQQLCSEAIDKVSVEHSLCIWQYWLEQLISHKRPNTEISSVFKSAIEASSETSRVTLALQYIDWSLMMGGAKAARHTYKQLLNGTPSVVAYSIYCKCIEIEKSMERQSMRRLRELYEKAITEWGTHQPDLWLDYISSEQHVPSGDPTRVSQLHWRAIKTLSSTYTSEFISKYSIH